MTYQTGQHEEFDEIAAELREYEDNYQRSEEEGWFYPNEDGQDGDV
jgi:hypothetical protein